MPTFPYRRTPSPTNQKALSDSLQAAQKSLTDELAKDKKYAAQVEKINAMGKQLQDLTANASAKFNQDAGPIQQKLNSDSALIAGLIPIVRKENDLPETATFDKDTQKWTVPSAEPAKAEAKK